MNKARLLSTVAATLLLTVGAASAQTMKNDDSPARAPAAQENAPAEKIAPTMKPGERKAGEKKTPETIGQAAPKASDADKKGAMDKGAMDKRTDKDGKADATKSSSDADVKSKTKQNAAEGAAPSKATESTTTGQGAAAGSAKLSTEQRSKVTTIFKQQKVTPAKLNVSVSVGTRVPETVHFYPVPVEVIVFYPEWRGYDYILVGNQIVIIDPRTHEIVAILEA